MFSSTRREAIFCSVICFATIAALLLGINNAKSPFPEPVGICTNRRPFAPTGGHPGLTLTGWCFYTSRRGLH